MAARGRWLKAIMGAGIAIIIIMIMGTFMIMTPHRNGLEAVGRDADQGDAEAGVVGSRGGLTQATGATRSDRRLGQVLRDPSEAVAHVAPSSKFQHLLFTWLSPGFPVGAFAYSHGLEMAAERGLLKSQAALAEWISALITQGSLRNDLLLVAHAYRAAAAGQLPELASTNALALALQPSAERYLETTQQGGSFLIAVTAAWPQDDFNALRAGLVGEVAYPIAVAMAAAAHAIPLAALLDAYGFAFVSNLTSAAIRLGVVGQTAAQVTIAAVTPLLHTAALIATGGTLSDIGSATFSADLCSMEHETQYSRLFRS